MEKNIKIALVVGLLGIFLIPTLSELLVAVVNKYSVYAELTDTNMMARHVFVQSIMYAILALILLVSMKFKSLSNNFKLKFLILALVGYVLMVIVIPSFLPQNWCEIELRIYSCTSI